MVGVQQLERVSGVHCSKDAVVIARLDESSIATNANVKRLDRVSLSPQIGGAGRVLGVEPTAYKGEQSLVPDVQTELVSSEGPGVNSLSHRFLQVTGKVIDKTFHSLVVVLVIGYSFSDFIIE